MPDAIADLVDQLDAATSRLHATVRSMDPATIPGPSLCDGWTRGHVLAHLARHADGARNLLTWARTGVPTPKYASTERRNTDIEAGAPRPLAEQLADLSSATDRLNSAVSVMGPADWDAAVDAPTRPASQVLWSRLREVEVHHVDLDVGYTPADWPEHFAVALLGEALAGRPDLAARIVESGTGRVVHDGGGAPTITGPAVALAAWLIGRSDGRDLTVEPAGSLPELGRWL